MKREGLETLSDGALAEGIAGATDQARAMEAELVRRFAPRVRLYGLRHLREGESAADDLVQRVMVLTLEKLRSGQVREPDRIGSFVLGAARTLARTAHRSDRLLLVETVPETQPVVQASEPDPHLRARLGDCLQTLSERERALLVMTFAAEQSADEIGARLGLAAGNVRVTRHRALAKLRDCLGCQQKGTA